MPDSWLRTQFAARRSCDRQIRLRFSVVFIGVTANVELVTKFHTIYCMPHTQPTQRQAQNLCPHVALQMLNQNFAPSNSKPPAQLLSSAHNNAHFLTLYLLRFITLYPRPQTYLCQKDERHCLGIFKTEQENLFFLSHLKAVYLAIATPTLSSLCLSLSAVYCSMTDSFRICWRLYTRTWGVRATRVACSRVYNKNNPRYNRTPAMIKHCCWSNERQAVCSLQ